MTLQALCEPIFLEVCNFNKYAAELPNYDLRSALRNHIARTESEARKDPLLASQFAQIKKPLVYFIDDFVVTSPVFIDPQNAGAMAPQSVASWQNQILEDEMFNTQAGGAAFFTALDQTLDDPSRDSAERLLFFQTCLGLGFMGQYRGQPAPIQQYMARIRQRLDSLGQLAVDVTANICPEAYFTVTPDFRLKPTRWLRFVVAGFIILAIGVSVFYFVELSETKRDLTKALDGINSPAAKSR